MHTCLSKASVTGIYFDNVALVLKVQVADGGINHLQY
jgi:hypothetical protein